MVVRGSTEDKVDADGNVVQQFDLSPGSVVWVGDDDLPETHALRNTGDEEIWIVTTEFL